MTYRNASRREFLRAASAIAAAVPAAGAGFALNLASLGSAAAQAAPDDYKALVCVFLFGGCDHANTVLATDSDSWNAYLSARSAAPDPIALDAPGAGTARAVLPIVPDDAGGLHAGRAFALHPNLGPVKSLFDAGRAAVLANVGPLIVPTGKAQYSARSVPLPPKLFSHNDQQSTWMAHAPEGARTGWGGRLGDLFAANNAQPVFTCVSAAGNSVFVSGRQTIQYQVSTSGAVGINGLTNLYGVAAAPAALQALLTESRAHLIENEFNRVAKRSIDARAVLNDAIAQAPALPAVPAGNGLAAQLRTVAQIIGGRGTTGAKRQVFFVSLGGFDNHDGLNTNHGNLMRTLADAIGWFDAAMTAMGTQQAVTLFTASDFGRTLTSNGDGSDHGWGSHHLVVGGAVRGRQIAGRFPAIGINTNDDVGQGRLLPTVAVEQYASTLGRWFGASDAQLLDAMPNLANFTTRDLGLML